MKRFVNCYVQAHLDAEVAETNGNPGRRNCVAPVHRLPSRVGVLDLTVDGSHLTEIPTRFAREETEILRQLVTMLAIGRVSMDVVRSLADELCGHSFKERSIVWLTARINTEIAAFMWRQLEREYPMVRSRTRTLNPFFGDDI